MSFVLVCRMLPDNQPIPRDLDPRVLRGRQRRVLFQSPSTGALLSGIFIYPLAFVASRSTLYVLVLAVCACGIAAEQLHADVTELRLPVPRARVADDQLSGHWPLARRRR